MNEKIERAMEMQAAMTILQLAKESGDTVDNVYRRFRRSNTFKMLFDAQTGLWETGPIYIEDEFIKECG